MKKRQDKNLDLMKPQGEDEIVFTPLEMTRTLRFLLTRMKVIALVGIGSFLVVVLGVTIFAVVSNRNDNRLQAQNVQLHKTIKDVVAQRTENQLTACNTTRDSQIKHNDAISASQRMVTTVFTVTASAGGRTVDPVALKKFIDRINIGTPSEHGLEYAKIPLSQIRDCSPAGIAAYYANKTPTTDTTEVQVQP